MTTRRNVFIAPVLALMVAGCSAQRTDTLRGDVLVPATKEPAIALTDTGGASYDLSDQTRGQVVLVYFGYTHCPDVCPTIMADVAQALRQSSPAVRSKVSVVFISVDPKRDTLPVLRRWLDNFNPDFIGLRGPIRKIIAIQRAADVPVSKVNPHSKHGYDVEHSAELLAFTPDRLAHVLYTDGPSTIADLTHDLAILAADQKYAA